MLYAGGRPVSQGNDTVYHLSFRKGECPGDLLVGKAHPAAVEPQRLGKKDERLSKITDFFSNTF